MLLIEEVAENFGAHFKEALSKYKNLKPLSGKTLIIGVGGSGMPGAFATENSKNIHVHKGYIQDLKDDISSYDNIILCSYSGSTEEVIGFANRINKFIAVTCGGELEKIAIQKGNLVIKLPENFQPRAAIAYPIAAFSYLFDYKKVLESAVRKEWIDKTAKEICNFLENKNTVCICGVPGFASTAYYLKASINENSKMSAFYSELPEDNHCGLEALSKDVPYIIFGTPSNDRIKKRIQYMISLGLPILEIKNNNSIELLWTAIKASVLLAKARKVNPNELERVPELKKFLS